MAFTCKPCHHAGAMSLGCDVAFETGRVSRGPCENCGQTADCTDCRCRTVRVLVGREAAGKTRLTRSFIEQAETMGKSVRVEQPNWQRCPACGKCGPHTHSSKPTRLSSIEYRPGIPADQLSTESDDEQETKTILDTVIGDVLARRAKRSRPHICPGREYYCWYCDGNGDEYTP